MELFFPLLDQLFVHLMPSYCRQIFVALQNRTDLRLAEVKHTQLPPEELLLCERVSPTLRQPCHTNNNNMKINNASEVASYKAMSPEQTTGPESTA